jgi:hypothetical protein
VVIDNFDIVGTSVIPEETDAPLVVDADTVLTGAIALKQFETITGWHAEIFDATALVDHAKFSQCDILYVGRQLSTAPAGPYQLGLSVREAFEHVKL